MWFVCGAAGERLEVRELRGPVGGVLNPEIRILAFSKYTMLSQYGVVRSMKI